MNEPLETAELLAFSKTVEAKSLSRAASELGLPRATISRRLARLEERLGTRLLKRTTRSLVLTDSGEALYRHARIVLTAVEDAEASIRRSDDAIRGDLRVSVPPLMSRTFNKFVCEFARTYPAVRLHVHFSARHVDLVRGGFDVALRATAELEPGLVARTLARMPVIAVASPRYIAEMGEPRTRRDLRKHRCLMNFATGDEIPQTHWPVAGGGKLHVDGAFFSNDLTLLGEAALSGLGIALLPLPVAESLIESGELVQVLKNIIVADTRLSVVRAEREFVAPHLRAFIDAVAVWVPKEIASLMPRDCSEHVKEPIAEKKKLGARRAAKPRDRST